MAAASASAARGPLRAAIAPALPEADDAVRREEHDDEEAEADQQAEAVAVEPDRDQEVEREGASGRIDQGADERPDRTGDAADDGDDENVDRRSRR